MTKQLPSPDELNKLLVQEPITGRLFWRHNGKELTPSVGGRDCRYIRICKNMYPIHRVIWAMHTGAWPSVPVGHIDGDRTNNRIQNLRQVHRSGGSPGESGFKGVDRNGSIGRWRARIAIDGTNKHLGYHDTPEEARAVYCRAAADLCNVTA